MKTGVSLKNRQGGAVAVIVGISIVLLVGFLALVIDLGHLYLAKTGLQNAADAAALSGAKQLNGTALGIDDPISGNGAVQWAQKLTADGNDNAVQRNRFLANLGWKEVALPTANIHFSNTPYPTNPSDWKDVGQAKDQPAGLYFIKVDTQSDAMGAWFAAIWNIFNINTYGSAVAGRFLTPIAPMGVCALDVSRREKWVQYDADPSHKYKVEFGYMRGVSYDLEEINRRIGGLAAGDALYLHPMATSQADCQPNQGSAGFTAPFLCTGRSAISGLSGSKVFTNTGLAAGPSIAALNTRFNLYGPPLDSSLDHTVCPPDPNIRAFIPGPGLGGANNWMTPTPQQTAAYLLYSWLAGPGGASSVVREDPLPPGVINANVNAGGCNGDCTDKYGVLWSYTRPELSSGSSVPADWPALYPLGPVSNPAYTATEPAYQFGLSSENPTYYLEPTPEESSPDRRVLNVVLVDCPASSGGVCRDMPVLGVGKFFMQRTATVSAWISGEFAGLIPEAELSPTIRLYR